MLETKCVGDKFRMLVYNDVGDPLECHQRAEKCHQHTFFLSPTFKNGRQHNDVTSVV